MDKFNDIIKQKVEQFEVPFNEAHWAEMDSKLTALRAAKIKKIILSSAAVVAFVAAASYFSFSDHESTLIQDNSPTIAENNTAVIVNPKKNHLDNEAASAQPTLIKNELGDPVTENAIEAVENPVVKEHDITQFEVKAPIENNEPHATIVKTPTEKTDVNANFIVYNNKVCLGKEVSFEALETKQPVSYSWNFGDGTISQKANPRHIYAESNTYTVSLTLVNRQTGKEYTAVEKDIVMILPQPKATFSYSETAVLNDDNKLKYPHTVFKITETTKNNTYKWQFGNGKTATGTQVHTIYDEVKSYQVILSVENLSGCKVSTKASVTNKNGIGLLAPNTILPNSDNLKNRVWMPAKLLIADDLRFTMTIISKDGKVVYQTADKNEPWNGTLNNSGQSLNEDVYLWQVITYDTEGTPLRQHGQINLIK